MHRFRFHILVDLAVVALVVALPFGVTARPATAARSASSETTAVVAMASLSSVAEPVRAQTVGRSLVGERNTISPASVPITQVAPESSPLTQYAVAARDTLYSLASRFHVSADAIAASNGLSDASLNGQLGKELLIPPAEGVLYRVQDGDTVATVADRYKVEAKSIMDYNRLYFEPERFAPGQVVFVPGAQVPKLVYVSVGGPRLVEPQTAQNAEPNGKLAYPLRSFSVTQYFWALHSGMDLAAPYGSPVFASADGVVERSGWVAVGGLSVQIRHEGGLETGYYHMSAAYVAPGEKVRKGQVIGAVGITGVTTGPHVHWEVKLNGRFVNPLSQ